jgi:DNA-directed RNA polymerase alpha subunit
LIQNTERDLLVNKAFGRISLREIKQVLAALGLRLQSDG